MGKSGKAEFFSMTWREAYLQQAKSDFECFKRLGKSDIPVCHRMHYLQMTTEKLAKAFLCRGDAPYDRTHVVFVSFLQHLKTQPKIIQLLGYNNNKSGFKGFIDGLLPIAQKIESFAPSGGGYGKINPEYPWKNIRGEVVCPVDCDFNEIPQTEVSKLLYFMGKFIEISDRI